VLSLGRGLFQNTVGRAFGFATALAGNVFNLTTNVLRQVPGLGAVTGFFGRIF